MANATCSVEGCDGPVNAHGWCKKHGQRWRLYGDPLVVKGRWPSLPDRFWGNVDADGPCWEWTGRRTSAGYGQLWVNGHNVQAHRLAWELLVSPILDGLEVDHLCRNRACVNPDHLEPVTHKENMRRAPWTVMHAKRAKTHCPKGHPYDGDNLIFSSARGGRMCRACRRDRAATEDYRTKRREYRRRKAS